MAVKEKKVIKKRAPKTPKERMAIAMKMKDPTRSMTNIVEEVYSPSSKSSATTIASKLLTKVDMTAWFDKAGLSDEVIAQAVTAKALTAKKRDHFSGEYEEDHRVQLDSLKFAAELKGLTKKEDAAPVFNYFQYIKEQNNGFGL